MKSGKEEEVQREISEVETYPQVPPIQSTNDSNPQNQNVKDCEEVTLQQSDHFHHIEIDHKEEEQRDEDAIGTSGNEETGEVNENQRQSINHGSQNIFTPFVSRMKKSVSEYWLLFSENPGFKWVWLSSIVSTTGNWLSLIAIITLVEQVSNAEHSSTSRGNVAIGGIFISTWVPPIILMPFTGLFTDFLDRRKVMFFTDLFRGCLVLFLLLVLWDPQNLIWLLYVVIFLVSGVGNIFDVGREGLVPLIIPRDQLHIANALDSMTWMTSSLIGSGLGGLITWKLGTTLNFILDSCTFFLSSFFVSRLFKVNIEIQNSAMSIKQKDNHTILNESDDLHKSLPSTSSAETTSHDLSNNIEQNGNEHSSSYTVPTDSIAVLNENDSNLNILPTSENMKLPIYNHQSGILKRVQIRIKSLILFFLKYLLEFFAGIKFLISHPFLLSLTLTRGLASFSWTPLEIIAVKYCEEFSGDDISLLLGIFKALSGLGSGVSPIVVQQLISIRNPKAMRLVIQISLAIMAIGHVIIYFSANFYVFCLGGVIMSIGGGMIWVQCTTLIQQIAPSEFIGRVFSFDFGFSYNFMSASSIFLTGVILDYSGLSYRSLILFLVGYCLLCFLAYTLWFFATFRLTHDKIIIPHSGESQHKGAEKQTTQDNEQYVEMIEEEKV